MLLSIWLQLKMSMLTLRKALVDLKALTVLTKAKFEEAESKFVAENPGN